MHLLPRVPLPLRSEMHDAAHDAFVHEAEAAIIRMIFDLFLKLDSASAIRGTPIACLRSAWNRMSSAWRSVGFWSGSRAFPFL